MRIAVFLLLMTLPALALVDPEATSETRALLKALPQLAERNICFGAEDATVYGLNTDGSRWWYEPNRANVKDVTGDYPAVFGWEIGHLEHGNVMSLDSVFFDVMRREIIKAYEQNGINTISWHSDNPLTGGSTWDTQTPGAVASILPGGAKHELYKTWLQRVADFAKSLKTSDGTRVPILFRPYHEHTGSWFWWGAKHSTPKEYTSLWQFTVEYLRDEQGVHNFLYVYSPNVGFKSAHDYLERYPGDDYVDMLGLNAYKRRRGQDYTGSLHRALEIMTAIAASKNMPCALTETGYNNIPEENWWTDELLTTIRPFPIVYVLVWRNAFVTEYYAPYPGAPSAANFVEFYKDPKTLFLNDLETMPIYKLKKQK